MHTILSRMGMAMERRVHTLGQFLHQLNSSVQTPSQAVPRSDTTPQPSTPATLPPPVISSPGSGTRFPLPKQFEGDPEVCRGFLTQCALGFRLQPDSFPTEESKVAYITTLLSGRALEWATAVWERDLPICHDAAAFMTEVQTIFGRPTSRRESAKHLLQLKQGRRSVADYAIAFRTLATQSGWEGDCLMTTFYHGLHEDLKDDLVNREWGHSLEELMKLTSDLDRRSRERRRERTTNVQFSLAPPRKQPPSQLPYKEVEEPVQLGRARISLDERERRRRENCCLYCGVTGHFRDRCPELLGKDKRSLGQRGPLVSGAARSSQPSSRLQLSVTLEWEGDSKTSLPALVDSGAEENLMDLTLAKRLNIPYVVSPSTYTVQALDGRPLGSGLIEFVTKPLKMQVGVKHVEWCRFFLIDSPREPLVLGYPWLKTHSPQFNWRRGVLVAWGPECEGTCSGELPRGHGVHRTMVQGSPKLSQVVPEVDLASLPQQYHDLREVFSKSKASTLPPHRPYDMAVDLLPGTMPPRGRLYPLSVPETRAMEEYIQEALGNGLITTSTSPASAGFFFVPKKDGGLRPCIDYRGLNKVTVKNKYPLPLMSTAFDLLRGAKVFSKLDLRNAYHLVRIRSGDEWKTAFSTPSGHYEYKVMPFGLSNCPSVFQALVNDVLREMINRCVFVYLDDILVFSKDLESHVQQVRRVLNLLWENKLFVKLEKCQFHVSNTFFLGFHISPQGVSMDPGKVQAVVKWPEPTSLKQVQRFLGFANFYRRFIRNFSSVAAPITALTRGQTSRIRWTAETQAAFEALKKRFTTAPILRHPDPALPFMVEVDASNTGVGAILSQRSSQDGKVHPCAFYSRKLTPTEQRYDVGDRELLAIKLALEEWRHWLEGATHQFQVLTDHKNLQYLKEAKRLNPRQARWALFF